MSKSIIKVLVLVVVCAGCLFGVNKFTAPIIEKNNSGEALGPLVEALPGATAFETLYDINDPTASTLTDIAETVVGVYKESNGLGYCVNLSTTKGYTHEPIEFTVGFGTDGKITGTSLTAYPETKDFGKDTYPATYVGQDSALADVQLVAGVTYSSSAFKNAVLDAFNTLIANDLIGAGVKSNEQIFTEMLPTVASGFANADGVAQIEEFSSSANVKKAYKALNNSGVAYICDEYLVILNTSFKASCYDTEGNEITVSDDVLASLVDDAKNNLKLTADKDINKIIKLSGSEKVTEIELPNDVHNTVTAIYSINGGKQYGFVTKPYHFSNEVVNYYFILDNKGNIVSMTADTFILEGEYFTEHGLKDEKAYRDGFVGINEGTYTDDVCLISGATFSSKAAISATHDVFMAFNSVKGK